MNDGKGRTISYLRLSVTDRCNFRCLYCMAEDDHHWLPRSSLLTFEEFLSIVRVLSQDLGISKVRVTGGEPLVRRGTVDFVSELCRVPGLQEVTLTTNGALFASAAEPLWRAGVRRVNFSLDTLRRNRFRDIAGADALDRVLEGIEAARATGFSPIKLNVVVLEANLDEAEDFVAFGIEKGLEVRFIECLPGCGAPAGSFVPNREIQRRIGSSFRLTPLADTGDGSGPAVRYAINGGQAVCGFISPMTEPFCPRCNRLRLQSNGQLIPCLLGQTRYDLMPLVRPRLDASALASVVRDAIRNDLKVGRSSSSMPRMSSVGG
jgi:cyclic pyranopterin phosphate synthase